MDVEVLSASEVEALVDDRPKGKYSKLKLAMGQLEVGQAVKIAVESRGDLNRLRPTAYGHAKNIGITVSIRSLRDEGEISALVIRQG
jgi:hypothetical protein